MLDATPVAVNGEPTDPEAHVPDPPARPSRRGRGSSAESAPRLSAERMNDLEAVLFASDRPLPDGRLAEVLGLAEAGSASSSIERAVSDLNADLERTGRVVRVRRLAGGWRVVVPAAHAEAIERLKGQRQQAKLSPAALETLAIVAYRQPIIRADIESIRGVASGEVLRGLLERRLVRITGRAEELGRPMLYGTTKEFLSVFGLASLADLPQRKEFAGGGTSKPRAASAPLTPPTPPDEASEASKTPETSETACTEEPDGAADDDTTSGVAAVE